jgi:hypothetical protein
MLILNSYNNNIKDEQTSEAGTTRSPEQYMVLESEFLINTFTKSPAFWDVMLCTMFKVNRRFGRTYRLCLQDRRRSQERKQHEIESKAFSLDYFLDRE